MWASPYIASKTLNSSATTGAVSSLFEYLRILALSQPGHILSIHHGGPRSKQFIWRKGLSGCDHWRRNRSYRPVLLSGGADEHTGIGLMIAQALEANGAIVYILGRRQEVLEKAASTAVRSLILESLYSSHRLLLSHRGVGRWTHVYVT